MKLFYNDDYVAADPSALRHSLLVTRLNSTCHFLRKKLLFNNAIA